MAMIAGKLMTAEEFFAWVQLPKNRDKFFELEEGEIIEMPPPGKYHGFVCGNAARILGNFAVGRRKGYPCTNDTGVIVERDPDTVRGPDLSFYEDAQSAADMDRLFAAEPPLLAIEVLSPNDRISRVVLRVMQLLNRGVRLVWVIDPEAREISVYRLGHEPYVLPEHEELTGDDILPDFRCRVAHYFAMPGAG